MNDLNSLLDDSQHTPLIDTSGISHAIQTAVLVSTILSILFLLAMLFWFYRAWKVQSAMLHMQKDIEVIKNMLETKISADHPVNEKAAQRVDGQDIQQNRTDG